MTKKYSDKSELELIEEFEDEGYVTHICPDCGDECSPTEVDSERAHCENCDELKKFPPVL